MHDTEVSCRLLTHLLIKILREGIGKTAVLFETRGVECLINWPNIDY